VPNAVDRAEQREARYSLRRQSQDMTRKIIYRVGMAAVIGVLFAAPGLAGSPQTRGRAIAEAHCGRCHSIGPEGESPLPAAPPFRRLSSRYPVTALAEALAEGIVTGHSDMPEFTFEPREIEALLAYLESVQVSK
jgi:cytochrome c